ncbi:hypothetical protein [Tenacibaculum sp. M341]|uniref:hypothetical protein n=1 Tax=Tenacibaculum sp. M341 TaxID=2530339 RepID=UPI001042E0D9|nr:hypothetical protein [Tenacibaculum sp. M341]TCI93700.1 hypothetical protein EYW44_04605 [Tenacibaculum sp. M341]
MKTILVGIFFIMFLNFSKQEEIKTLSASFDGYEQDVYYFSHDDNIYNFEGIEPEVLNSFDLKDESHIGKSFIISYKEKEITIDDEQIYLAWIITELKLTE